MNVCSFRLTLDACRLELATKAKDGLIADAHGGDKFGGKLFSRRTSGGSEPGTIVEARRQNNAISQVGCASLRCKVLPLP